jgi:hypothetical protein
VGPAGEGRGRKARMHVGEESHCGIVPMNPSNNDGRWSAEKGEGRPLNKENTRLPETSPRQSGARVSQGLAGVRRVAKEQPETLALSAIRRYSSELRAVCASERTYGSVRGVLGNQHPYRDRRPASGII